jgi:hypothetical protein
MKGTLAMANDLRCPKCGKIDTSRDDLHVKVSGGYTSGQSTGAYTDYEGYRSYDNIQSQMSRRLAPPVTPAQPISATALRGCGQLYFVAIMAVVALLILDGLNFSDAIGRVLLGIGVEVLLGYILLVAGPRGRAKQMTMWEDKKA